MTSTAKYKRLPGFNPVAWHVLGQDQRAIEPEEALV